MKITSVTFNEYLFIVNIQVSTVFDCDISRLLLKYQVHVKICWNKEGKFTYNMLLRITNLLIGRIDWFQIITQIFPVKRESIYWFKKVDTVAVKWLA